MNSTALEITDTADCKKESQHKLHTRGNEAAARFLERRGYEILEQGWSCLEGTADIICKGNSGVVFVEVKARSDIEKGFPSEAMNHLERNKLELVAMNYLKEADLVDTSVRFDVISIVVLDENRAFLRHHLNAFGG